MNDLQTRLDTLADDGVRGVELQVPARAPRRGRAFAVAVAALALVVGAIGVLVVRDADSGPELRVDEGSPTTVAGTVIVPDVAGLQTIDAMLALEQVGLATTISYEPSQTVVELEVIRADPAPGSAVAPATVVHLVVSSSLDGDVTLPDVPPTDAALPPYTPGETPTVMPELRGVTIEHALEMMAALDRQPVTLDVHDDERQNAGLVIDQSVFPGTELTPDQQIVLTVAR